MATTRKKPFNTVDIYTLLVDQLEVADSIGDTHATAAWFSLTDKQDATPKFYDDNEELKVTAFIPYHATQIVTKTTSMEDTEVTDPLCWPFGSDQPTPSECTSYTDEALTDCSVTDDIWA